MIFSVTQILLSQFYSKYPQRQPILYRFAVKIKKGIQQPSRHKPCTRSVLSLHGNIKKLSTNYWYCILKLRHKIKPFIPDLCCRRETYRMLPCYPMLKNIIKCSSPNIRMRPVRLLLHFTDSSQLFYHLIM